MKIRTCCAVVAVVFATQAFAQEGGRITKVLLYPGSATVERAVSVSAGQPRVELTGLPANFDPRTLRVEADPGIRIGEIAVRDVARQYAMSPRESELEARIQALKDRQAELDVEVKTAELSRPALLSRCDGNLPLASGDSEPAGKKAQPAAAARGTVTVEAVSFPKLRSGGELVELRVRVPANRLVMLAHSRQ